MLMFATQVCRFCQPSTSASDPAIIHSLLHCHILQINVNLLTCLLAFHRIDVNWVTPQYHAKAIIVFLRIYKQKHFCHHISRCFLCWPFGATNGKTEDRSKETHRGRWVRWRRVGGWPTTRMMGYLCTVFFCALIIWIYLTFPCSTYVCKHNVNRWPSCLYEFCMKFPI